MGGNVLGMLTRKQQWRRMKTRKCHLEMLRAMLASETGKSSSWNHRHPGGMQLKTNRVTMMAQNFRRDNGRDNTVARDAKNATVTDPTNGGVAVEPVNIPRSVSDSFLSSKRSLFPRSSSKHDLRPPTSRMVHVARRPHRKFVSFNPQVKIILVPMRGEYRAEDRARQWWGPDDYARFRQVLIDWKRSNAHRMSGMDNILSINLEELDDEGDENRSEHEEATTAIALAAGEAMTAATTAGATAVEAAAVAAAAVNAIEVARADENDQEKRNEYITPKEQAKHEAAPAAGDGGGDVKSADGSYVQPCRPEANVSVEHAIVQEQAKQEAAPAPEAGDGGDDVKSADGSYVQPCRPEANASGEHGVVQQTMRRSAKRHPYRHRSSFSVGAEGISGISDIIGGDGSSKATSDWLSADHARETRPLRRASTFVSNQPPPLPPPEIQLKDVALSDLQATVASLREWRKTLDVRSNASDSDGGGDEDESRGRAVSLQQQSLSYAQRGRATTKLTVHVDSESTPKLTVPMESESTPKLTVPMFNGPEIAQGSFDSKGAAAAAGVEEEEKQGKLNGQDSPPSTSVGATWVNPVLVVFERQQKEADALHAELDEKERARAAAMVEAAKAEAVKAAAKTEEADDVNGSEACGGQEGARETIIRAGMDNTPGSAVMVTSFGVCLATDDVSKPSLCKRDAIEIF